MHSASATPNLLGLFALLNQLGSFATAQVDYSKIDYHSSLFTLGAGSPIVSERLDPVISPGQSPSNHVHEIFGADTFGATWNYDAAQKSSCNNMGPKADHSNYWFPAMYFHGADDTFTRIPPALKVYYHIGTVDNKARTMFPKGFKMVAGNPFLRHDDDSTTTKSIKWFCHGPEKVNFGTFPEGVSACDAYPFFSAEIWFPFCWDGIDDFDAKDPLKHVMYGDEGTATQGGKCPPSHPKALPQLFMEFHYDITKVAGKPQAKDPWVLAPGDPTGLAVHADFINGWEDGPGSLEDAMAVDPADPKKTKCYVGVTAPGASECFEFLPDDKKNNCKISPTVDEEVDGPLPQLPGCNPIQPAGAADATVQTDCPNSGGITVDERSTPSTNTTNTEETPPEEEEDTPTPSSSSSSQAPVATGESIGGQGSPASITVSNGETWVYKGCFADLVPDRDTRALENWGRGSTSTDCAKHCSANYKIAGTEYGGQCFCGNALTQSKQLDDSACDMPCGNSDEICGGSSALSVYAKQGTSLGLKKRREHGRHLASHRRSNIA